MSDLSTLTLDAALSMVANSVAGVNYEQAIALCNELISSYPDALRAFRARAQAYELAGDANKAIDDYTRVLEIMPTDHQAMVGLARCLFSAEQVEEAALHARRALDYDPLNVDATQIATDAVASEAAGAEAASASDASAEVDAKGQVAMARSKFSAGMTNRAIADIRRMSGAMPDRTDLQAVLAEMLWRTGLKITTAELCQNILDAQPDCLNAHVILFAIWSRAGNTSLAETHAHAVGRLDPDYRETQAWLGPVSPFSVSDVPARIEAPSRFRPAQVAEENSDSEHSSDEDRSAWVDELIAAAAPVSPLSPEVLAKPSDEAEADAEAYAGEVAGTAPLEWTPADANVTGEAGTEEEAPAWLTDLHAQTMTPEKVDRQRFTAGLAANADEPATTEQASLKPLEWSLGADEEKGQPEVKAPDIMEATATEAAAVEPGADVTAAAENPDTPPETDALTGESAPVSPRPGELAISSAPKKKGRKAKARKAKFASEDSLSLARKAIEAGNFDEAADHYSRLISSGKKLDVVLADLDVATHAHPDVRRLHALLGDCYTRKGDVNAALMAYHRALAGS